MLPLGDSSPNEAVVGLKPLIGVTPLLGSSRSFPGLMDVKSEKPTYASVASPAPDTDADRRAADHGGDGADDSGSDVSTVPPSPALSLADLHAALTATAPTFPAYTLRATAAAPSKGRASYVRKFCLYLCIGSYNGLSLRPS